MRWNLTETFSTIMGFCSGVTTRHVCGWISVILLTSAFSVRGGTLHTLSKVEARCGTNLSLPCEVEVPDKSDIKFFAWLTRNKTCQYDQLDSEVCKRENPANSYSHTLTLILLNVMPVDQGPYLCKVRSTGGVMSNTTIVSVRDCIGRNHSSINESHAECHFRGVYPPGMVHWSQEGVNWTDYASAQEEEDQDGRFNIHSMIDVRRGNLNQPYRCSLWIPSSAKYLSKIELHVFKPQKSSGSSVRQQWIFIMVELMTATLGCKAAGLF